MPPTMPGDVGWAGVSVELTFQKALLVAVLSTCAGQRVRRQVDFLEEFTVPRTDAEISLDLPSNSTSIYQNIVDTFDCSGRIYGYYADQDNECRIFHICMPISYPDGRQEIAKWSFICPERTIFDQAYLVCNHEDDATPCEAAQTYYNINEEFGRIPDQAQTNEPTFDLRSREGRSFNQDTDNINEIRRNEQPEVQQFQQPEPQQFQQPEPQQFQQPEVQPFQQPQVQHFQQPEVQQFHPEVQQFQQPEIQQPEVQQFQQPEVQQFQQPAVQQFQQPPVQQFQRPAVQQFQQPAVQQFQQPPVQQFQQPSRQFGQQFQQPVRQTEPQTQRFFQPQQNFRAQSNTDFGDFIQLGGGRF
ncbi:unnamed protein product [Cyprideis torosa]|uniref:Uncharacterized protein n=1 Tax=Cyprideis torosa TaxID=163714 RepID=A0A7R8W4M2_9CRUS|nr:unnamed protein product [Cyprideis torosa]CAG0878953.1 unnamed protein product [Cyprideis torosa]